MTARKKPPARRKKPAVLNRTVFTRDNLEVMRGMDSDSVDLIYLDPPFNKKKQFHAPTGSAARGASFKDWWVMDDVKFEYMEQLERKHPDLVFLIQFAGLAGHRSNTPYLLYMAPRLIEMRRILKNTGSLYLHCDQTVGHYLKLLLDGIFGHEHFQNEVIWGYKTGGASKKRFARKHDTLFFYSKSAEFQFNSLRVQSDFEKPFFTTEKDETGQQDTETNLRDVWDTDDIKAVINTSGERIGYPTQKPLSLLERIIRASSNPGDMVLDPFCGCATTLVAAEKLGRQWIGIDVSDRAIQLVSRRLDRELGRLLFDPIHRRDIPVRGDKLQRTPNAALKSRLFGEQAGHCNICKTRFDIRNMTLDHIVATAVGGPDADDNIQLLCTACNSMKGKRSQEWAIAHFNKHWRRR